MTSTAFLLGMLPIAAFMQAGCRRQAAYPCNAMTSVLSRHADGNGAGGAVTFALANLLTGNTGNNVLDGKEGADVLTGGGSDTFVFTTPLVAGNIDTITDFRVANDTIRLNRTIFNTIMGTGTLSAAQFVANASFSVL